MDLATPLAGLTLLAIATGAVAANVLNIYSGALSFNAAGIRLNSQVFHSAVTGKVAPVPGRSRYHVQVFA